MNDDEMTAGDASSTDFWGGTPDWTDAPRRPRREKRSSDVGGKLRGLWSSAMTAGAGATREHGVLDASVDPTDAIAVGPQMFDDLDDDLFVADFGRAADDASESPSLPTSEVPVIDVFDDEVLAVVAPASMIERAGRQRRSGALDPLLVRVGAVAIATTLLVPLVIALSAGGDGDDTISSATAEAAAAVATLDTTPLADEPVATDAGSTAAGLDPESLPPAVPVNTNADSDSASAPSTESSDESNELSAESSTSRSDSSDGATATTDALSADSDASNSVAVAVNETASAGDGAERVTNCAVDYSVVAGDFWLRLAEASGVSLAELLEANGASVNTPIYPGSEICLPAGATTPAPPAAPAQPESTSTAAPTTTPAPTTTAAPTTTPAPDPAPNTDATPGEVEQIIRDVWPDELEDRALEIAFRESRYVPTAKNYCCYGLFQIYWNVHKSWLDDIGITSDQQLYDPATNARAAYALYQRSGGWGPWSQTNY